MTISESALHDAPCIVAFLDDPLALVQYSFLCALRSQCKEGICELPRVAERKLLCGRTSGNLSHGRSQSAKVRTPGGPCILYSPES